MAILLTGGTGKTSLRIADLLQDAKIRFVLASRKAEAGAPSGMQATKFDWLDPSTFENPFQHRSLGGDGGISAVYLVAPEVPDVAPPMTAFIDHAVKKHGVKRFVILAPSSAVQGGPNLGKVWQHVVDLGLEYCVLLPTWFMENFLGQLHRGPIVDEGKIYSACGHGKIPFISATDIAAVAFRALTDERPHNTDYRVLGPELLAYDQVAEKFSKGLGREVVHVKLSEEQNVRRYVDMGVAEHLANFINSLEVATANGAEERLNDAVERVTGRPPQKFDAWVQENKAAWQ